MLFSRLFSWVQKCGERPRSSSGSSHDPIKQPAWIAKKVVAVVVVVLLRVVVVVAAAVVAVLVPVLVLVLMLVVVVLLLLLVLVVLVVDSKHDESAMSCETHPGMELSQYPTRR